MAARFVFFAALFFALQAQAQEAPDLVTDRPDQTESALVVPRGWVQLEGGVLFAESAPDPGAGVLGRIGLVEGVEVRLGLDADLGADARIGGLLLGSKVAIRGGDRPVALLGMVAIPVEGGTAVTDLRVSYATPVGTRFSLGLNGGVVVAGDAVEPLYTAALGTSLTRTVSGFVELYGSPHPHADAGLTWLVRPNVQLDVSAGRALEDRPDSGFVGLGISYRLPR